MVYYFSIRIKKIVVDINFLKLILKLIYKHVDVLNSDLE